MSVSVSLVFRCILAILCAFFVARAGMFYAGYRLAPKGLELRHYWPEAGPAAPDTAQGGHAQAVVQRNLFGPAALGLPPPRQEAAPALPPGHGLKLLGTMEGERPYTVIWDEKSQHQGLYRVGQEVRPGLKVKDVQRFAVVLATARGKSTLTMGKLRSGSGSASAGGAGGGGLHTVGISRAFVQHALGHLGELRNQVEIAKVMFDDRPAYLVDQIQPKSIFSRADLLNGDLITGVDGYTISSPQQVLQMASQVPDSLVLNLIRNGKPHDITVTLK